ncbi:MAG: iron ABC transporter permease [Brevibacillus sp.]|nr:iron ABC transporter permease [Brevibacillus sp.]
MLFQQNTVRVVLTAVIGLILLVIAIIYSTFAGTMQLDVKTVWQSLWEPADTVERAVVWDLRLPRALTGALVGACLAVSGVLMQGITRNPLVEPKIIGVSAGASLFIVVLTVLMPDFPPEWTPFVAMAGAAAGGLLVYSLASQRGVTPIGLTLAGVAVSLFLNALMMGILVIDLETAGVVIFWLAGGLAGRDWAHVSMILPWAAGGFLFAWALAKRMNALQLGDEVAQGLGISLEKTRLYAALITIALAGSAVAVAGPIGFVGLVVPHVTRALVGGDHRVLIPVSAVIGACLLVCGDIAARTIREPLEWPVGVLTAFLGGPFFLYLLRKERER